MSSGTKAFLRSLLIPAVMAGFLLAVVLPKLPGFAGAVNDVYWTGFQELGAELLILVLLLRLPEKEVRESDRFLLRRVLPWTFASLMVGDGFYFYWVTLGNSAPPWTTVVSEVGYSAFMTGLLVTAVRLFRKLAPSGRSVGAMIGSYAAVAAFSGVFLFLTFRYVLIPFYVREDDPGIFHFVNSTYYGVAEALVLSLLIPLVSRVRAHREHLFLQSLFLLFIADFAIRFQSGFPTVTSFSAWEYGWQIAVTGMLYSFLSSPGKALDFSASGFAKAGSLRALLSGAIFVSVEALLGALVLLDAYTVGSAMRLTNMLLMLYAVWVIANLVAIQVSQRVLTAGRGMLRRATLASAETSFEIDGVGDQGEEQLCLPYLSARTGLAEIDELIGGYNRLNGRTNALIDQLVESRRLAALGQLASEVAHDIRAPLAALKVASASLPPEEEGALVRAAVGRIQGIADTLMRRYPKGAAVVPCHLGSAAAAICREKALQHGNLVKVELFIVTPALFARAEPLGLRRALSNLIENAVEAGASRVRVTVEREGGAGGDGGGASVRIADDGRGMAPEVLSRAGTRGFTHGKSGGSGLGLHATLKAVESWNGHFRIESEPGKGTEVVLSLQLEPKGAPTLSALRLPRQEVIAICDDEPLVFQAWRARLPQDVRVEFFPSLEALEVRIAGHTEPPFGALLLDYRLQPGRTGLDFARSASWRDRIVLVTGEATDPAVQDACARIGLRLLAKEDVGAVELSFA